MSQNKRQVRSIPAEFTTRDNDGKNPEIEGYFAVYDNNYDIAPGMSESIARGAFARTLQGGDIRALVNHNSTLVLGRTKANTLQLREDTRGLWGKITVNPNDSDAMNLYQRVKRGDVSQCSFGFEIRDEESVISDNGDIHWTLKDLDLYEVSCCTFPAYEKTNIEARTAERSELQKREREAWQERMKARLKNGVKSIDGPQKAD